MVYYQHMAVSKTRSATIYALRNPYGDPFLFKPGKNRKLEIIGLLLWATEGDKTQLSLSNGNPDIIVKYLEFLRQVCRLREERIKAVIHCHDTLPYRHCLAYWSRLTGIPRHRFRKPHIKRDRGGTRKFPYGILRIVAFNAKLIHIFKERLKGLGLSKN